MTITVCNLISGSTTGTRNRTGILGLALLSLALAGPSPAQETRGNEFVLTIPEEGMALDQVISLGEKVSGRTFIIGDPAQTKGKIVRMLGSVRVSRAESFGLFQAILVTQGFALSVLGDPSRGIYLVENIDTAKFLKQRAPFVHETNLGRYRNDVGTVIMTSLSMRHIKVANVRGAVAQILGARSAEFTQEVESANAMIVVAFAPTVYAVAQIIGAMDVPSAEAEITLEIVSLKFAVAEELAPILKDLVTGEGGRSRILGGGGGNAAAALGEAGLKQSRLQQVGAAPGPSGNGSGPKIIAEPRTNALLLYAALADLNEIKRIIAQLDVDVTEPQSNIHIFKLKNSRAEDVGSVLRDVLGQSGSGSRGRGTRAPAANANGGRRSGGAGIGTQEVRVVAETHNNALLVVASKSDWQLILPVIEQLDQRRPQVLVQAAIVDLNDNDLRNIGVEIAALQGGDEPFKLGGLTGFGLSSTTITSIPGSGGGTPTGPGTGTGTGGGQGNGNGNGNGGGSGGSTGTRPRFVRVPFLQGNTINVQGGVFGIFSEPLNVPLLVSLLKTSGHTNLLSMPTILSNDNEQSSVESSRLVATTTLQTTRAQTDSTGFGGYQEAKVELIISPHVSNDHYVRLEIDLTVEAFQASAESRPSTVPPDKTHRRIVGSVMAPNGRTVAIGGLLQEDQSRTQQSVPFLADIPLLGELFKNTADSAMKDTLYVFVTPTIIEEFNTIEQISAEKKLELRKLEGQLTLVDREFHPTTLDDPSVPIDGLESSGNLDIIRYAPLGSPAPEPPLPGPTTPEKQP